MQWTVVFSESVSAVDNADFALANTGLTGAGITSTTGSGTTWTVTANTGSGAGTLGLNLVDDDTIVDPAGNRLGGAGVGNGNFTGQVYAVDRVAPTVTIDSTNPNPTSSGTVVTWHASENGSYSVRIGGTDCSTGTVVDSGSYGTAPATVQTTIASALLASGTNTIRVCDVDVASNVGAATVTVTKDTTAPTVSSINRQNPLAATTNLVNVTFRVTFSEAVTGVDSNDFTASTTGTVLGTVVSPVVVVSASVYDVSVGAISGDGTLRLDLNASGTGIQDLVGNAIAGGFASGQTYVIDHTAPTVSSVTGPVTGTYGVGQILSFTVNYSENVAVAGTPTIGLTIGATARNATYFSGSGTSALVFRYTVVAGDNDPDGIASFSPIVLNGGTMQDAAGNNAGLSFTPPDTTGVLVDTIAPTVTNVSSTAANGSYTVGAVIPVTVTFSEPVTVTGTPQLALNSGGTATYSSGSGTSTLTFNYTVAAGQNTADLNYNASTSLTLNAGTIRDVGANNANLTLPATNAANSLAGNKDIVIDTAAPTVTNVTSTVADGSYTVGAVIPITVTFSEAVTVTGTPQLALNSGGTSSYTSGSGTSTLTFTYTVSAGQNAADLNYVSNTSLTLSGGTIKDTAGNNGTLTLPATGAANSLGGNKNILIDTSAPGTASVTAPANNAVFRAATVPATFSGSVADNNGGAGLSLNSTTFAVQRGSDNFYWNGSSWQAGVFNLAATNAATTSNAAAAWTSSATLPTWSSQADGTYTVRATATDKVGNSFTGAASTFTLDSTNPAAASVTTPAGGNLFRAATVPATFGGSAADNSGGVGLAANSTKFTLQRGSDNFYWTGTAWQAAPVNLAATNTATSGGGTTTWTDNVTLPVWANQVDGTYAVSAVATDAAGNTFAGPASTFTLDRTAPAVTVNLAAGQNDPATTQPVNFTVVFSEPINTSTFINSDVTITGTALPATKTVTVTQIAPNDGTTFNVAVSGITAAGTVIASIPAGAVSDPVGNTSNASTSTDNQVQVGRATSMSVTCTPSEFYTSRSTTCTATVTDISPGTASAPDGTVSFTTSAAVNTGANFTPTSCTLASPDGASKSCSVTYNAAASTGTTTITASYPGIGLARASSSGSATLDVLPPRRDGDPATGGSVFLAGGSASAGSGFIETWWLTFQGNSGSYTGTGMNLGGAPQIGNYIPGDTAHCVFNPPIANPDQYLNTTPPCTVPATAGQTGTPTTSGTATKVGMDE
ncbi:MAG: beta strand repeat-containing protein [Gaiellaceae bacterium]